MLMMMMIFFAQNNIIIMPAFLLLSFLIADTLFVIKNGCKFRKFREATLEIQSDTTTTIPLKTMGRVTTSTFVKIEYARDGNNLMIFLKMYIFVTILSNLNF